MTERADPFRAYRFGLEISGLQQAGFQAAGGLERSCTIEPYREGGVNHYEHQLVTLTSYPVLVLKRGLAGTELWDWHQDVINGSVSRQTISVVLFDDAGAEAWRWVAESAFPSKWAVSELDAMSNGIATESVEFVHHGLTRQ